MKQHLNELLREILRLLDDPEFKNNEQALDKLEALVMEMDQTLNDEAWDENFQMFLKELAIALIAHGFVHLTL